jgi:hypothetical protein
MEKVMVGPVPTLEATRIRLGLSKKRVAQIRKIMETPRKRKARTQEA